jgi:hypothetical protein
MVDGLRIDVGDGDTKVKWTLDPNAAYYVICTVRGESLTYDDVASVLDDSKLRRLCGPEGRVEADLPDGRRAVMTRVSQQYFASGNQGDYRIAEQFPVRVQVWELSSRGNGQGILYVPTTVGPTSGESKAIPARYRCKFQPGNPKKRRQNDRLSFLTVEFLSRVEDYQDGALWYQVGSSEYMRVPIPRAMLNKRIPLMLNDTSVAVSVKPRPECAELYIEV